MTSEDNHPPRSTWLGALIGLLALAAALGVAELVAAMVRPRASPVVAVGGEVIDMTPAPLKEFAIRTFGTADKPVLIAGIVVVLAVFAAGIGIFALRRPAVGVAGVAAVGLVGAIAAVSRPGGGAFDVLPSLVGAAAGVGALLLLRRSYGRGAVSVGSRAMDHGPTDTGSRRAFLASGIAVAGVAVASGGIGRALVRPRQGVASSRSTLQLPRPDSPASPVPAGADLEVPGLGPFVTPNREFYRVDTALLLPRVQPEEWSLRVHGMVDREIRLTYDDLLRRRVLERDITLACVSNPVGGPYVGHARWLGVSLADLLREAGVHSRADQILSTSSDGWTCGTPTEVVMDGRDAMLAFGMNGKPLPVAHGFPVRMVVPGLYGYVSATKWVVDIELTRFDQAQAYWVPRGWAEKAPVKTMSRIDIPGSGAQLAPGRVAVAGVAWAQHRGIEQVEVQIDEEPWRRAELAAVPSPDTWRQWVYEWDAPAGEHRIRVRATDGTGRTQTDVQQSPAPDGATGWHTIDVTVA